MSVLRNLEAKLEGLVGGAFSRAFKSRVQPVEIARKLAKEMQDNQTVSISRTYVPNHYTVYLSPQDREQFEGYEDGVKKELSDYLLEHARTEGLALITSPTIEFETDDRLALGEFGIQTALIGGPDDEDVAAAVDAGPSAGRLRAHDGLLARPRGAAARAARGRRRPSAAGGRRQAHRAVGLPDADRPQPRLRHHARGPERLAPARRAAQRGRALDRDRPGLHQRHQGERAPWGEAVLQPGDELTLGLARLHFELE